MQHWVSLVVLSAESVWRVWGGMEKEGFGGEIKREKTRQSVLENKAKKGKRGKKARKKKEHSKKKKCDPASVVVR